MNMSFEFNTFVFMVDAKEIASFERILQLIEIYFQYSITLNLEGGLEAKHWVCLGTNKLNDELIKFN